jgi:hypothetical protein
MPRKGGVLRGLLRHVVETERVGRAIAVHERVVVVDVARVGHGTCK